MALGWRERRRERRRIAEVFQRRMGRPPRWWWPRDFSDKLQWLKVHHRDPRIARVADKLAGRDWVADRAGPDLLTPLLGVWKRPAEIDFEALPDRFVLKLNAASQRNVLCRDRAGLDPKAVRARFQHWLAEDFGADKGEWHYGQMPRCILAEPLLEEPDGSLWEWKPFCFDGEAKLVLVLRKRGDEVASIYLDREGRPVEMSRPRKQPHVRLDPDAIPGRTGDAWPRMLDAARRIALPFPYLRVDFIVLGGRELRFEEATFFPLSGMTPIRPLAMDRQLGEWLKLPR